MNRTMLFVAAAGAALALASPASTHNEGAVLVIRHQLRGCHAWSLNGGPYTATQTVWLKRGVHLGMGNNDVMPHKLVKVSGPAVTFMPTASMKSVGEMTEIRFSKAGVYRFTTRAGEDYTEGVKTIGEDNFLKLKVVVR
jgi:hypothetical protein